MRPVPLLWPAATTRRRTHALVFNFASVGREALLDGRFAPEAAVSRFQLDREGSPKTTSPRDSAAAILHHWAELLGLRRLVTARRQRALCRSQLEDRRP